MKRPVHPIPRGLTLVELMVALTLGLIVTLVVVNVFLSNRGVYRVNEQLSRLQENARYALEVLARDLREAGRIPCGTVAVTNENQLSDWLAQWKLGIRGYGANEAFPSNANAGNRAAGTDAAFVYLTTSNDVLITNSTILATSAQFEVNTTQHGLNFGDIVMACSGKQAALFKITKITNQPNSATIDSVPFGGNGPEGINFKNGWISRLTVRAWYIGCNSRADCTTPAGRSLYQFIQIDDGRVRSNPIPEELVEGVSDLQLKYLTRDGNSYVTADQITDWSQVVAVRVELTFATTERVGTNQQEIARPWYSVIALRNRLP